MISTRESTTTYWWICIFLFAGFLINCRGLQAQGIDHADSLFAAGNWREAAMEYERKVYQRISTNVTAEALISKAECLKRLSNYKEAYRTISRIPYEDLNDTLEVKARYQGALAAYLDQDFALSESELKKIQFFISDSSLYNSVLFLHMLVLNEQRKWEESKLVFEKMVSFSGAESELKKVLIDSINVLYDFKNYPRLKNKNTAVKWATFLPGSGHIYAGYTGEGIMNFTLQLASLGFTGYHIYISHYITAFTIGSGMFQHFYFGGINRVEFLVDKKNYSNQRKFNETLKEKILSFQQLLYGVK